jgi:hypothetical protein
MIGNSSGQTGTPLVLPALIIALLSVVVPVLLVRLPALWDYPNHLVRYWILLGQAEGTPVAAMYRPDWSLARTNIGADLLAVAIGSALSFEAVTPVLVSFAVLVLPVGAIALNRAVFGGWHFWQVGIVVFTWNFILVAGLLSYQIALGIALLAATIDLRLQRMPVAGRWLLRLGFAAVILMVHVFGLLFFLMLLVAIEIGSRPPALRAPKAWLQLIGRLIPAGIACTIPLAILILTAPSLPGAHERPGGGDALATTLYFHALLSPGRLLALLTPFRTYSLIADVLTAVVVLGLLFYALARGKARLHAGLFGMGLILLLCSQLVPFAAFGTHLLDARLPIMAALMMASGFRPVLGETPRGRTIALAATLLLVVARSAFVGAVWSERQADVRSVEAATVTVQPGAAVLLAENDPVTWVRWMQAPIGRYSAGTTLYRHTATTIVISRHAFVPTIFTAAGKQPLRVLPPWTGLAVPEGGLPGIDDLDDPRMAAQGEYAYLTDWRRRFDYLLLVNADLPHRGLAIEQVPGISLVSDEGFARLYRIDRRP